MRRLLIQRADTGILNMDLRNTFNLIGRYQITAAQGRNYPISIGAQNIMIRLVNRFQLFIRLDPLDRIGIAVFIHQMIFTLTLLKFQVNAGERAAIFIRFSDNDTVNHCFINLHMHMACDNGRQLWIGLGDIANPGAGALILIIDAHMGDQHDGVYLWFYLLNNLFHFLHWIGEMDAIDTVSALCELRSHRGIHTNNADFHPLTFDDFIRGEVRLTRIPEDVPRQCRAIKLF